MASRSFLCGAAAEFHGLVGNASLCQTVSFTRIITFVSVFSRNDACGRPHAPSGAGGAAAGARETVRIGHGVVAEAGRWSAAAAEEAAEGPEARTHAGLQGKWKETRDCSYCGASADWRRAALQHTESVFIRSRWIPLEEPPPTPFLPPPRGSRSPAPSPVWLSPTCRGSHGTAARPVLTTGH